MAQDPPFSILYQDNHLLVVNKPAGMLIQGDKTGDVSLLEVARSYIKREFQKPGAVYLGLVHRLDRPVSGVIVFARTSKAAGRLSSQIRNRQFAKIYWALVAGNPPRRQILVDYIRRAGPTSHIATNSSGKKSELQYRQIWHEDGVSMLEIDMLSGRHHQIRLQLANAGYPIIGDFRYGSKRKFPERAIALHARAIKFQHPVLNEVVTFAAEPAGYWPVPNEISAIPSNIFQRSQNHTRR